MRRRQLLHIATLVQSISAIIFLPFLVLHLAAPAATSLLDEGTGDAMMLISRDLFYHRVELIVLSSPLVHVMASISRRLLSTTKRPLANNAHAICGILMAPMLMLHVLTHRLWPQRLHLSPNLITYREFVAYALQKRSIAGTQYLLFTSLATYHAAAGLNKLVTRGRPARVRGRKTQSLLVMGVGSVGLGLRHLRLLPVPSWLRAKYDRIGML